LRKPIWPIIGADVLIAAYRIMREQLTEVYPDYLGYNVGDARAMSAWGGRIFSGQCSLYTMDGMAIACPSGR
jgi:hypothetical protein